MATVILGIDLGTTKLCALALDATSGQLLACESALNTAGLPQESGAAEQAPDIILTTACTLLQRLLAQPALAGATIAGVGVTGQMHGVVLVDAANRACSPLITWQDARGNAPYRNSGRSYAKEVTYRLGPQGIAACGCTPATGYGAVTLLRLAEEGALPTDCTALTIHDYLVAHLCGARLTDPTDAASWGICDMRAGGIWCADALELLPFLPPLLPEIRPTTSQAGTVTAAAATATGVPIGTPVAVALGDNQASLLGTLAPTTDTLFLNLGTGGQMSMPIAHYAYAPPLETRPWVDGQSLLVGASLCGGRAYQVLAEFFAAVGCTLFDASPDHLYDQMTQIGLQADPNAGGLRVDTRFAGTRNDPALRGMLSGLDTGNWSPGNLIRAVANGMVDELLDYYALAQREGARAAHLVGAGNAVRRNPLVREAMTRRLGLPVRMPPYEEEAAVGAALTGAVAAGLFSSYTAARAAFAVSQEPSC